MRGKWVFPRARLEVRGRRVFPGRKYLLCIGLILYKLGLSANSQEVFSPGETPGARKVGVSPGETGGARKTGFPRTKVFAMYWTNIV